MELVLSSHWKMSCGFQDSHSSHSAGDSFSQPRGPRQWFLMTYLRFHQNFLLATWKMWYFWFSCSCENLEMWMSNSFHLIFVEVELVCRINAPAAGPQGPSGPGTSGNRCTPCHQCKHSSKTRHMAWNRQKFHLAPHTADFCSITYHTNRFQMCWN